MPRDEAEELIRSRMGNRLCIRMHQRADGTLITQDCPVAVRLWRQRVSRGIARVAAAVTFMLCGIVLARTRENRVQARLPHTAPFAALCRWVRPPAAPPPPPAPPVFTTFMGSMS
jgi:hypothetical protein